MSKSASALVLHCSVICSRVQLSAQHPASQTPAQWGPLRALELAAHTESCYRAGGEGVMSKKHAATLTKGSPGVLHGSLSYLLQDDEGQIIDPHSISAGPHLCGRSHADLDQKGLHSTVPAVAVHPMWDCLDYPGIGPEHAFFKDAGRAEYHAVTDAQALEGFKLLSRAEGILPVSVAGYQHLK
eukprot:1147821-Pelagomonas_calceolata.AAC.16